MFETSRPQSTRQGRLLFIKLLPVSLAAHAAVALAILLKMVWTVAFPATPPKFYASFHIADTPPPPPPPPPPPAARPQQATRPDPVPIPREIVAPTMIPDEIPVVTEAAPPPVEEGVTGGVEGGVEGGEIGGVVGGVEGGVVLPEPAPPPPPDDGRVHIGLDKPLPLEPIEQPYPDYPGAAVKAQLEDRLAVRYVIGTNGRVKDVVVISNPQHEMFIEPTLKAIRRWKFRPMIVDGERREVVHELTVRFKLTHRTAG
jgi:protein TonB